MKHVTIPTIAKNNRKNIILHIGVLNNTVELMKQRRELNMIITNC